MKRLLPLSLLVAACGGAPTPAAEPPTSAPPAIAAESPRVTPDAPFRQKAPGPNGDIRFAPPQITEGRLANGLRVLVAPRRDLPIINVRFVVTAGAGDVPDARPGALSLLGTMLAQGTKKHTALEISDKLEDLGASHATWFGWDSGGMSIRVLSHQLDAALEIMADVMLSPTFPADELERVRARRLTAIQAEKSSPGTIVHNAINAAVFGRAHPYGHSLTGREADVKGVGRAELVRAYARLFTRKNAALVIVGDVSPPDVLRRLEQTSFAKWKPAAGASRKPPASPTKIATDKRVVFVDRPGAQSQVQLVRPGVPHSIADRDAFLVANAILGGMFSSRVNMNLREKNAYTYGARSAFVMRHGAGPFLVGAAVFAEKTGPAIKEILAELEHLRREGPTDEELAHAKENLRLALPARFETVADLGSAIADIAVYDLALDEYEKRPARIEAVTAEQVQRVASEYFAPDKMIVVVVGDRSVVLPQLAELGLGDVDERDAYGDPIPAQAQPSTKPSP